MAFRVLSYNIHQGLTVHRRQLALSLLKDAIRSLKADVVLLQEVAGRTRGRISDDTVMDSYQLEALADRIWPYYAFGRNAVFSGGFHGNAILSRFPICRYENVDISIRLVKNQGHIRMLPRRGLLHAEITLPEGFPSAHVIGTHFGLLNYERQRQLQKLCDYVKGAIPSASPFLVGGDFNDWHERITPRLCRALKVEEAYHSRHARHARTFPSRFPVLALDRIYFRGLQLTDVDRLNGKPWKLLSDHLPILADFLVGPQANA